MNASSIRTGIEAPIISKLETLPIVSVYAGTRGWPFILSWCHRISGLFLVAFVLFHIYTLSSLSTPAVYEAKMKIFGFFLFAFLEWALAIPVIFHALNGGRLILYENFGSRNDETLIRWMSSLSIVYLVVLGLLMMMGNQSVSAVFFWLIVFVTGLSVGYAALSRIWASQNSLTWKLQRITGAYLLVMVPAHMLFMHLNYAIGHDANTVVMRMQNYFIKLVDLSLVLGALYHAGYGLMSVIGDYLGSRWLRTGIAVLVVLVMVMFAFIGAKLTISI
jgi:succinate dehydrogenase cytochrome b556 subunit